MIPIMELFRSANTDGINECRPNFNFLFIPTEIKVIDNRKAIFESKFVILIVSCSIIMVFLHILVSVNVLNVCIVCIILSHYVYSTVIECMTILVTVRPVLRYRCPAYLSCRSVMLVYCGQRVGWIKMTLGTETGLRLGDIVLDGDSAPPRKGAQHPILFCPYCLGSCLLWQNGRPFQLILLSSCSFSMFPDVDTASHSLSIVCPDFKASSKVTRRKTADFLRRSFVPKILITFVKVI